MTYVPAIVQPHIPRRFSKLQNTNSNLISIDSLSALTPPGRRANLVECNEAGKYTWLWHNASANAVEDSWANDLVVVLLACQGSRSAINFGTAGERCCQTSG